MSTYQYSSPFADAQYWPQTGETSGGSDPKAVLWVPVLVPFWEYPPTFYYADDEELPSVEMSLPPASCQVSADASDSYSDASTDVGDDDLDQEDDMDEEVAGQSSPTDCRQARSVELPARRPSLFAKLSKQQRVDQLRRVIDEFCELEFDTVDASSQGALTLRLLTILKSLREPAVFHDDVLGRCEQKRLSLLGLGIDAEHAIEEVIFRAEERCEARSFHAAFDILKEAAPRLRGQETSDDMPNIVQVSAVIGAEKLIPVSDCTRTVEFVKGSSSLAVADDEAMRQRRLDKRQRQRQERREQRKVQKTGLIGQSSSLSSAAAWHVAQDSEQLKMAVDIQLGKSSSDLSSANIEAARPTSTASMMSGSSMQDESTPEEPAQMTEPMSAADIDAMKQRRLEKRQRQRQDRREQRTVERNERSAQRYKPSHGRYPAPHWQDGKEKKPSIL